MAKKDTEKKSVLDKYPSSTQVQVMDIKRFSSQSISLDRALGGGFPVGRVIEFMGEESSGKTTVCLHALAEVNFLGKRVGYVDTEHSYDPVYAANIGIVPELFHLVQPDSAEEALQVMVQMAESGEFGAVALDSVAALVPRAELEGEVGDSTIGLVARLMSQTLRKITGAASKTGTTLFFISQLREKISVMYGDPRTTTGGRALRFYSSIRIDVRRQLEKDKPTDIVICSIKKNKTAPPFEIAEFKIRYGKGIDKNYELLQEGIRTGIIEKKGSWYAYDGDNVAQGEESMLTMMNDNHEFVEALRKELGL